MSATSLEPLQRALGKLASKRAELQAYAGEPEAARLVALARQVEGIGLQILSAAKNVTDFAAPISAQARTLADRLAQLIATPGGRVRDAIGAALANVRDAFRSILPGGDAGVGALPLVALTWGGFVTFAVYGVTWTYGKLSESYEKFRGKSPIEQMTAFAQAVKDAPPEIRNQLIAQAEDERKRQSVRPILMYGGVALGAVLLLYLLSRRR